MPRWLLFLFLPFFLMGCGGRFPETPLAPGREATLWPTISPSYEKERTSVSGALPSPISPEHFAPRPEDENLRRGNVYLDSAQLVLREGQPPQVALVLQGHLPTPCHALRVAVHPPEEDSRIRVEVYAVVEEEKLCAQVLAPFEAQIPLGGYAPGHYLVLVNDKEIGEFDV